MPPDLDLPLMHNDSDHINTAHKNFIHDYSEIVEAIEIVSGSIYRIGDIERDLGKISFVAPPGAPAPQPTLELLLRNDIYGLLYKRAVRQPEITAFQGDKSEFLIALSHANTGRGTWEPGWKIVSVGLGDCFRVTSGRGDVVFVAGSADLELEDGEIEQSAQPLPGAACRVFIPKELRQLNAHYYMAFGDARLRDPYQRGPRSTPEILLRYYWHLTPAAAPIYIAGITSRLNWAGIPFRTKVLSDPKAYGAADAGVLYIDSAHRTQAKPLVMDLHAEIAPLLSPSVPLFTHPLSLGLGHAEDPDNGESYGVSRARLAAIGLVSAYTHGETSATARIGRIREAFADAGLDPDQPYRQPTGAITS
jgi:hypothetical protein